MQTLDTGYRNTHVQQVSNHLNHHVTSGESQTFHRNSNHFISTNVFFCTTSNKIKISNNKATMFCVCAYLVLNQAFCYISKKVHFQFRVTLQNSHQTCLFCLILSKIEWKRKWVRDNLKFDRGWTCDIEATVDRQQSPCSAPFWLIHLEKNRSVNILYDWISLIIACLFVLHQ